MPATTSVGALDRRQRRAQVHRRDRLAAAGVALGVGGASIIATNAATSSGWSAAYVRRQPATDDRLGDGSRSTGAHGRRPLVPRLRRVEVGARAQQRQPIDPLRVLGGERHRDHRPERQPDEVGARSTPHAVEGGEHVGADARRSTAVPSDGGLAPWPGWSTRTQRRSSPKRGDLPVPHRRRAAQRSEPDDRRPVRRAGVDNGEFGHVDRSFSACFRLAAIRSTSTTIRSRLVASQSTAEPPARSRALSAGHSACHAPAARSKSWPPAACSSVATRPGTCIAAARAQIAATGLCLWAIDEEPPAPSARSTSSPTSLRHQGDELGGDVADDGADESPGPAMRAIGVRIVDHGHVGDDEAESVGDARRRSRRLVARTTSRRRPARRAGPAATRPATAARRSLRRARRANAPVTLAKSSAGRTGRACVRSSVPRRARRRSRSTSGRASSSRCGGRAPQRGRRRPSPRCRGCPGSSPRGGHSRRRRRRPLLRSCSTSPITGTPPSSVAAAQTRRRRSRAPGTPSAIARGSAQWDLADSRLGGGERRLDVEHRLQPRLRRASASAMAPRPTRWANGSASDRQEHGLIVALQADVEAVPPGCFGGGDEQVAALGRDGQPASGRRSWPHPRRGSRCA